MKYYHKFLPVIGIILCSFLVACAPKIIPMSEQPGAIDLESNIITREKDGIRVSIQTEEWQYPPYSLTDYFTPFLFLIRNNKDTRVPVRYSGLILFDEHGNQFEAIPPEGIEYRMVTKDLYGGRYPDMLFRFEETRPPYTYGFEIPTYLRRPFSNISILALPEGLIYPNSQVRGFVYFRKAVTYGENLRLRVEIDGFEEEFEFIIEQ